MDSKTIAVILLVLIALGLVYFSINAQAPEVQDDGSNNQADENPETPEPEVVSNQSLFLENLMNSGAVYIVMDTREATNQTILEDILQCGVDLAGSPGLVDKNVTAISLEEGKCWGMGNSTTLEQCLEAVEEGPTFYVTSGTETQYFENKLVVSINEEYELGSCAINVVEVPN